MMTEKPMFTFLNLVRALGDESRVRILMALRHRPLCVCEITTLLGLAASRGKRGGGGGGV